MINVNTITEKLSLLKFEVPKVDLPKIAMPRIDLTNLDLAKVDLPKFNVSRATDLARDAAYIAVGAVVVSVQTADERRRDLTEQITGQFSKVVRTTE